MLKRNLRARMDRWIGQARLAGGLDDESDAAEALRSASLMFYTIDLTANSDGSQKSADTGSQILSAFMVAAANMPTGSAGALDTGVDEAQNIFASLARNTACDPVRPELDRAARMNPKTFASALLAFAF